MNVFVVSAPYQILNAIEAVEYFNFKNNILVVLHIGLFDRKSFDVIVDKKYWDSVRVLNFFYYFADYDFSKNRPRNIFEKLIELYLIFDQFKKRRCIERLFKSIGTVENLFLGNYLIDYDLHMRHIANIAKYKNLYLLDVGTDTLRINKQRIDENLTINNKGFNNRDQLKKKNWPKESFSFSRIKHKLRAYLIEWNKIGVDRLTYFTCYSLQVNGKDQIVKNDYVYSKSLLNKLSSSQDILFLGQPLVEQGYLNFDSFITYMQTIKNYFNKCEIFYVPHPRESKKYIEIIRQDLGIKIRKSIAPFEYEIIFNSTQPKCIAAFFTSALENCAAIFGNAIELISFQLPEESLLKHKDIVKDIYENYGSNDFIKIVDLL